MINTYTVADRLYTIYCQSVGGKSFNGDPLLTWSDFYNDETKTKQSKAWLDVADEAIKLLLK